MIDRDGKRDKKLDRNYINEPAIQRKTVTEALQQPMTLLPLALSVVSALYLTLLSPIFGGTVISLIISAVSGSAGIVSFVSDYRRIYLVNARQMIVTLEEEHKRGEEIQLERLWEELRSGFLSIASTEGLSNLASLTTRYQWLHIALDVRRDSDSLAISLIPALAKETYRRGLSVLSDALELMKIAQISDRGKLEKEISRLEIDLSPSGERTLKEEQIVLKREILASYRERLEMIDRLHLRIEQLLHQARRCESALESTQIELTTTRASGLKAGVDSVIKVMQNTILQAKEVQDELDKLTE